MSRARLGSTAWCEKPSTSPAAVSAIRAGRRRSARAAWKKLDSPSQTDVAPADAWAGCAERRGRTSVATRHAPAAARYAMAGPRCPISHPARRAPVSPPRRCAIPRAPSAWVSRAGADQVVGVGLLRHLLERPRAADEERDGEDGLDGHAPEHGQGAEQREGQRHRRVGAAEEDDAVAAVGQHAGGQPDEEEGGHAESERHADQERRVREVEHEPAEDDLLARERDRVQQGGAGEPEEARQAEERRLGTESIGRPTVARRPGKRPSCGTPRGGEGPRRVRRGPTLRRRSGRCRDPGRRAPRRSAPRRFPPRRARARRCRNATG